MGAASTGRAGKGSSLKLPRVPRALAARPPRGWPMASGQEKPKANQHRPPSPQIARGSRKMTRSDPEIEQLRASIHCATVLERQSPPWRLDRRASTKHCLKYRRGKSEILIVNHEGRGWWDPQSEAKGDVFDLIQHFDPNLNFGRVRKVLREFIGLAPAFPETNHRQKKDLPESPPAERWSARPRCNPRSRAWRYLAEQRCLPSHILAAASKADVLRSGPHGSAWFAHRDDAGHVTHVEIRGPAYKGSLRGGTKVIFRITGGPEPPSRLALTEAPIDALSLAAIEGPRADTLYAATGGGMGEATIKAIERVLSQIAVFPDAILCSATDANRAGERYALRHQQLAGQASIAFMRLRPPIEGGDWNDVLRHAHQRSMPHETSRLHPIRTAQQP
jgi:hypothetical protein